jgi:hypothetical protein
MLSRNTNEIYICNRQLAFIPHIVDFKDFWLFIKYLNLWNLRINFWQRILLLQKLFNFLNVKLVDMHSLGCKSTSDLHFIHFAEWFIIVDPLLGIFQLLSRVMISVLIFIIFSSWFPPYIFQLKNSKSIKIEAQFILLHNQEYYYFSKQFFTYHFLYFYSLDITSATLLAINPW